MGHSTEFIAGYIDCEKDKNGITYRDVRSSVKEPGPIWLFWVYVQT